MDQPRRPLKKICIVGGGNSCSAASCIERGLGAVELGEDLGAHSGIGRKVGGGRFYQEPLARVVAG
jgi:hypothetical protein